MTHGCARFREITEHQEKSWHQQPVASGSNRTELWRGGGERAEKREKKKG
ncbi:hypothetical protein ACSS6W_007461 [Trichoderma asperelloides]